MIKHYGQGNFVEESLFWLTLPGNKSLLWQGGVAVRDRRGSRNRKVRAHIPNHTQVVTEQTGSEGRRLFTLKAYSQ